MFPGALSITNIDQLTKVMAALSLVQPVRVPTANEMVAEILNNEAAMADTKDTPAPAGEAPGKPSAAKTAPSPPTAEAAPSQPAPSAAAPGTKAPGAAPPGADAPSASVPPPAELVWLCPAFAKLAMVGVVRVLFARVPVPDGVT